jgi:DUF971 family protein
MAEAQESARRPTEIRLKRAEKILEIDFADGSSASLPAELLRVESPSAEVRGHSAGDRRVVAGKRNVGIERIETVGNYAIRILFDDGHDTGIYSWRFLRELAHDRETIWRNYLDTLTRAGLSRDP